MDIAIYDKLKTVATAGSTITYSELANEANRASAALQSQKKYHQNLMHGSLNEINRYEHERGWLLLSAVVINKGLQRPSSEFFELPRELGLYSGNDEEGFWRDQLRRVHTCWKQHSSTIEAG